MEKKEKSQFEYADKKLDIWREYMALELNLLKYPRVQIATFMSMGMKIGAEL